MAVNDFRCGDLSGRGGMLKAACVGVLALESPIRDSADIGRARSVPVDAVGPIRRFSGLPPVRVLARARVLGLRVRLTPLAALLVLAMEFERDGA